MLLAKDRTGDTVDCYGRLLRYVLLDGDNFNARLIREGYAHSERSLFNWKNKRGGEGSGYGTAAEIAGLRTRPPAAVYTLERATFRAKSLPFN